MPSSKRTAASAKRGVTPARRGATPARRGATPAPGPADSVRRFGARFGFIGDTIAELKKVTWLTRRETAYLTGLVLLVAVSVGVVLGLLDLGLSEAVSKLLLGG